MGVDTHVEIIIEEITARRRNILCSINTMARENKDFAEI